MKNIASCAIILSFVFSLISCSHKEEAPVIKSAQPVAVDALVLQSRPFANIVEASGTIVANEFVELRVETPGRITQLNIPEGKIVQQGTVLATLFNDDLQAQQDKLQAQYKLAEQTQQRLKQLLDVQGVSQQEYDNAVNTVTSIQADINVVKAQLRKTQIIAPFTGMVGLRNVSIGAYVTASDIITTIQQTANMKIDFTLPEDLAYLIKTNNKVDVQLENDTITHKATIIAIEPQVNTATRNLKVRAVFSDNNLKVNAGGFGKVLIDAAGDESSFILPSNAIIPDSKGNMIVLIKNKKAKFQYVGTGGRSNGWVQVSSGVQASDTVAINGVLYLKPEADVQIKSIKSYEELNAPK